MSDANTALKAFGYQPQLRRALTLPQLICFGLTYLQPIGPAVIFGFLLNTSQGSVALPYLLAFVAMLFTLQSYSILVKAYPLAGSVYHYVKLAIGPFWGFLAGWLIALDYILVPTITVASAATYANKLIPTFSYEAWLLAFIGLSGFLNLRGIRSTARVSHLCLYVQIIVVLLGFWLWIKYFLHAHSFNAFLSFAPFQVGSLHGLIQASSLAIFSFLGFDAVTTLAEEAHHPRRDIPLAMMICTSMGFFMMFITGYLGMLLLPHWKELLADPGWLNATLFQLAKLTGGNPFAMIYTGGFILGMLMTNLVAMTAVSRLLYGMGRDGWFFKKLFSTVHSRWQTPHWNILFLMGIEIVLGSGMSIDVLAELVSFGAIAGFMLLNISIMFLPCKNNFLRFRMLPFIAFLILLAIFINMKPTTLIVGSLWGLIGITYYSGKSPGEIPLRKPLMHN